MNQQIQKICERADLEEIRKFHPRILPIKDMLYYLETKYGDYELLLCSSDTTVSMEVYYMQQKIMNCISYLKKIQ